MHHACFAFAFLNGGAIQHNRMIGVGVNARTHAKPFTVHLLHAHMNHEWVKSLKVFALLEHDHITYICGSISNHKQSGLLALPIFNNFKFSYYFICFNVNKLEKLFMLMVFSISLFILLASTGWTRSHYRR